VNDAVDLNGPWEIRPDHDDQGVRAQWFTRPPRDGWLPITVPSAWQLTLGEGFHGVAWYRRHVSIPWDWLHDGSRVWLCFESAATDCRAWVAGREVGRHVGDYLPFQFDLTSTLHATMRGPGGPPIPKTDGNRVVELIVRVDEIHADRPPPGETTESGHITKGFHDVLSLQHGGLWGGVTLRRSGSLWPISNGVVLRVSPDRRSLVARIELEPGHAGGEVEVEVPSHVGPATRVAAPNAAAVEVALELKDPLDPWSPGRPVLYEALVRLADGAGPSAVLRKRFGARTVAIGGPGNRSILLNGEPLCVRGVLHWGIEPRHAAPAPPPEQVEAEFARLKDMGFNCVCLCMVYLPEHYYETADRVGMLLWQEHPVWKSRMDSELLPEYRRLMAGFFRRDRGHPSVVIVSGSCEHERIHPDLARWWRRHAGDELPGTLSQVQTAFLSWVNPDQTDLHDEHVYESSGRWVCFLEDVQSALAELPPKPFVMGETVIGTSWVDTGACPSSPFSSGTTLGATNAPPWWVPKGLAECRDFERRLVARHGPAALDRFMRHADRSNLLHRKFQSEAFRSFPNHAGWVMNQLRDVPAGRLGFMDERDRWRFAPDQTRAWLADCPILLRTPDRRSGFFASAPRESGVPPTALPVRIGVSNFGAEPFEGSIELRAAAQGREHDFRSPPIRCDRGDVAFVPVDVELPHVGEPTRMTLRAVEPGLWPNGWDLWLFPPIGDVPDGVVRLDGLPFDARDRELDFEERAYSSGWGLKIRTWTPALPHPERVLFKAPLWRFDAPMPRGTRVVLTHKLTSGLVEFMRSGGRVVWLAAGKSRGSLPTRFVCLWGQCPLVPEEGPLGQGDSDWVVDLLHHDLTRRYTRAIPVEDLGARGLRIADQVAPIVRLVFTHDRGAPGLMDAACAARVGRGLLIATSLDHTEDAGRYLLRRFLDWAGSDNPEPRAELDPKLLEQWVV
jgi:hypothetical protein